MTGLQPPKRRNKIQRRERPINGVGSLISSRAAVEFVGTRTSHFGAGKRKETFGENDTTID